jgi:glycosyltransferase involved in cell wall biosynthesis
MTLKIALVVSHPIQHFCPQYVSFASNNNVTFKVFFASALGLKKYMDPNFKQEISWGNLNLEKFDHLFLNGDTAIPSDKNIDAPSLESELLRFAPDVVIIYGYYQKLQRRAHSWAVKNKVKIAYISDSERRHHRSAIKELLKYLYIRNYFSKINYFLSVGDANEEFYRYYGVKEQQIIRMHFPIDVVQYEAAYENRSILRKRIREQYGLEENEVVLLVVGKLAPWKNQDHIIDALKILEEEGLLLHLFILGSGQMMEPWKTKAKEMKKSKVHFPGFIAIDELPAYYAASDIYVHPASVEPHSIAVSEAIYMGLPVVISDRCGSYGEHDDVQENKNGYVFPFGNHKAMADKLKMLMSTETRKTFGNYSHHIAKQFQQRAHYDVLGDLQQRFLS